jgi:uncharacterized membrane protein
MLFSPVSCSGFEHNYAVNSSPYIDVLQPLVVATPVMYVVQGILCDLAYFYLGVYLYQLRA